MRVAILELFAAAPATESSLGERSSVRVCVLEWVTAECHYDRHVRHEFDFVSLHTPAHLGVYSFTRMKTT